MVAPMIFRQARTATSALSGKSSGLCLHQALSNDQAPTKERSGSLPTVSLVLIAAALVVMPFDFFASWLQYDRAAVGGGQVWRLFTCQITHWSWDHFFWDAAALLVLGWVIERENRRSLLTCLGLSLVLIPAVVHFALPELATYRGLSGIDSAVFVLLAVTLFHRFRAEGDRLWTWACLVMLAGFTAKVAFELVSGGALFVDSQACQMQPVPLAHVVGGLLGLICTLPLLKRDLALNSQASMSQDGVA